MSEAPHPDPEPRDPYAGLEYRRLIAWSERIRREADFLESIAGKSPERSILDLGCGTGEHARFFAERGYRVLGLDASPAQIRLAREAPLPANLRFEVGDLTDPGRSTPEQFGTALTVGNTLVHVLDPAALAATCRNVFERLRPGGAWLVQILNYERLRNRGERALQVNVLPGDGEEIVFVRLLRGLDGGMWEFVPVTLRWRSEREPPVELVTSQVVQHRGWLRDELARPLAEAGFTVVEWFGDMRQGRFDPLVSTDLVFVARRA